MPEYGYKKIPVFDPKHYQVWTSNAIRAFDERGWLPYLLGTNRPSSSAKTEDLLSYDTGKKTPHAFLNASIPYAYKARIDDCNDAAELWEMLKQEFATFTASDEARLEAFAYDFRKSAKDTIDEHTTKFVNLIAQITTHQVVKYTDAKINNLYLRSLELSSVPNEDWKLFVTSLGETYSLITRQTLYSTVRSYYLQHMQTPDKKSTVDFTAIDTKAIIQETVKAFVTQFHGNEKCGDESQNNKSARHCTHCNRNGHTDDTCYQLHGYPPNTPFCSHCKRHGHSYDDCRSKNNGNGPPSGSTGPPAREKSNFYRQATVARAYAASEHGPRTRDWLYDTEQQTP
jgi:gag-polypeptide of LTR copia-type